ncbi:MAG: M28 family peptidase [Candidatus Marinimicrobia bacterium]|nr:M28 family peptidase [Candidatus Neomarinimicrobiota bacterium]
MNRNMYILLFAFLPIAIGFIAQVNAERKGIYHLIFGEVFYNSAAYSNLRELSDNIGGRVSGTKSGYEAERWALNKFNSYGLQNPHFERFEMPGWERGSLKVEVATPDKKLLSAAALANTPSKSKITEMVIDVGFGHPDEFEKLSDDIKGKIVLAEVGTLPDKRSVHRTEKVQLAMKYGAAGFILITNAPGNLPRTGTVKRGGYVKIPAVGVSAEHGTWLRRYLKNHPDVKVKIDMKNKTKKTYANNIIAEIRGSELPDEVVIVGAHLDSWDLGQGTIDNGVGSVTLLETARVLSKLKAKPKRTIRFILFMGEEFGLYGSSNYIKQHSAELGNIVMMLNMDMIGDPFSYKVYGHDEALPFLKNLAADLQGFGMEPDKVVSKAGLHSDHESFMLAGVPAMSLAANLPESMWRYYHSAGDTFDKASETFLNNAAVIAATTLLRIADEPERIGRLYSDSEIRDMLIKHKLKEPLSITGQWRWSD